MDLNRASIIGRVVNDIESRTTPTGQTVVSFSVATNFRWTDATWVKQDKAEFHNIVAWRKLAETIAQYLKKGSRVYIEGRLQTRSWDDQSGNKKYRTEIIADSMIMLDSKGQMPTTGQEGVVNNAKAPEPEEEEINIEDIPF